MVHGYLQSASLGGVGSSGEDSADVLGGSGDLDESLVSPGGTPGVLDEEVVNTVLGSVSDGEDTVVEVGSASGGDDSTGVHLEGELVGLDGNGDGSEVEGGLELGDGSGGHVLESSDLTDTLGLVVSAGSLGGLVGVVTLGLERVGLGVLESEVHESTVATVVTVGLGAVNELLLGERGELAGGNELSTLDGTGGGEGPAGSAHSLVLDGGDTSLGDPVDGGLDVGLVEELGGGVGLLELSSVSEHLLHLSRGNIGELVESDGVGSVLGVVLLDGGKLLLELGGSELELSLSSVRLSVLGNVSDELVVLSGEESGVVEEKLGGLGGSEQPCPALRKSLLLRQVLASARVVSAE